MAYNGNGVKNKQKREITSLFVFSTEIDLKFNKMLEMSDYFLISMLLIKLRNY